MTAVFSWREAEFVKAFGDDAHVGLSGPQPARARDPARAGAALPAAANARRLAKNDFAVRFTPFDWQLNDLTGGRPR